MVARKRPASSASIRKRPASSARDLACIRKRPAGRVATSAPCKRPASVPAKSSPLPSSGVATPEHADVQRKPCWYYKHGGCTFGDQCESLHDASGPTSSLAEPLEVGKRSAGVRFVADRSVGDWHLWKSGADPCTLPLGPVRLRIMGDLELLGWSDEGWWDPEFAMDLFWEGERWTSLVVNVAPKARLKFSTVTVHQEPHCPGLLIGHQRRNVHAARKYIQGKVHYVDIPAAGEVLEVHLEHKSKVWSEVRPRYELVGRPCFELPGPVPAHAGRQHIYSFEEASGSFLNFCLYLPIDYKVEESRKWPVVVFLHSMHCSIDRDNNMFYESDTPLWLLQTNSPKCPETLRKECILLAPICPECTTGNIWLRDGWFEESTHSPSKEAALAAVIESVAKTCHVDRHRISVLGSSMGAYAALELSMRWPRFFSAAGLAAAHYEIEPIEPLVARLAEDELPAWFFHATNDTMCPHEDVERIVAQLRAKSKAEIRFTSYLDTWSMSKHHVDPVAFFAPDRDALADSTTASLAHGEALFSWLVAQRRTD